MLCYVMPVVAIHGLWGSAYGQSHHGIFLIGLLQCNLYRAENHLEALLDPEYSGMDSYGCSSLCTHNMATLRDALAPKRPPNMIQSAGYDL